MNSDQLRAEPDIGTVPTGSPGDISDVLSNLGRIQGLTFEHETTGMGQRIPWIWVDDCLGRLATLEKTKGRWELCPIEERTWEYGGRVSWSRDYRCFWSRHEFWMLGYLIETAISQTVLYDWPAYEPETISFL